MLGGVGVVTGASGSNETRTASQIIGLADILNRQTTPS
jgi:hypothetical protein